MNHKSFYASLPFIPPFDKNNWYDSFLGNIILPIYQTGKLARFWFSHYGGTPQYREAKFRFSTNHFSEIEPTIANLIERFQLTPKKERGKIYPDEYDILDDFQHSPSVHRFLGINQQNPIIPTEPSFYTISYTLHQF